MALFSLLFVFFSSLVTQLPGELFRSWFSCVYVINQNFNARLNLNNCMDTDWIFGTNLAIIFPYVLLFSR